MIDGFEEGPLLEFGLEPLLQIVCASGKRSVVTHVPKHILPALTRLDVEEEVGCRTGMGI